MRLVYQALGARPPAFAHAPTVLGADRSKLSKRTGARPLRELREEGLHPDAVVNYLSLLGWSSPSEDEVLSRDRLLSEVTLDRVNAADVVFDPTKMSWLSARHIEAMPLDQLADATRPYVEQSELAALLDGDFAQALDAVRSHLSTFSEITEHLAPFLGASEPPAALSERDVAVLEAVHDALAATEHWDAPSIQDALKAGGRAADARGRSLYVPVRQALTGVEHGPPLAAVMAVQGRDRVLERLRRAAGPAWDGV